MELIAHRGSSGRAPENTLVAIAAALEDRADAVEIDVQATRDGELVLLHDVTLARTAGDPRRVVDLLREETRALDVGNWFAPAFKGEPLPSLWEVLDLLAGRLPLHVEVKASGDRRALADLLLRTLDDHPHGAASFISSADVRFLRALVRARPGLRPGRVLGRYLPHYLLLPVGSLSVPVSRCSRATVRRAHDRGRTVLAYTVNDASTLERLRHLGVDGVFTDEPARLRAAL